MVVTSKRDTDEFSKEMQQFPLMTCRPSMTRVAESLAGVVTGHFLLWERLS
jgi:hypothetical protein